MNSHDVANAELIDLLKASLEAQTPPLTDQDERETLEDQEIGDVPQPLNS
ncbi:hypothetical protein LAJ19_17450 (plasmid) [Deinococcus taeanensis]|nr:hypothetical protein [Deinococcus taeanensis]UBV44561.1 hypothetical protein LAJ19_17450 [Deinococcus taeanensis]